MFESRKRLLRALVDFDLELQRALESPAISEGEMSTPSLEDVTKFGNRVSALRRHTQRALKAFNDYSVKY